MYNKVFECTNLIKIEGGALSSLIPYRDVDKVTFVTDKFRSDIEAVNHANSVVESIMRGREFKKIEEYNPDFYPSVFIEKFNEKRNQEIESIKDNIPDHINTGAVMIPLTHAFDEFGDYVQYKSRAESERLVVSVKTISDVDAYFKEKQTRFMRSLDTTVSETQGFSLH
jgi:hypothetical protein